MSRALSLVALSTLLLATAVEAYSGRIHDADGYRDAVLPQPSAVTRLLASTDAASVQGDNCGVAIYSWLDADGQPIGG